MLAVTLGDSPRRCKSGGAMREPGPPRIVIERGSDFFRSPATAAYTARALPSAFRPSGGSGGHNTFRQGENPMFSHIMIGSNDIARSKKFYDAVFAAMGAQPGVEDARGRLAYTHNGGRFMVSKPIDGKPAAPANGGTIGFAMSDAKQAEAWHKAGVANGGTSIEDPPGIRQGAAGQMFLAYLRDPDGNKLCALCRL
jgi:catechol 2,3-dioxygenase-like lactoylglutathione lyase family enzyme